MSFYDKYDQEEAKRIQGYGPFKPTSRDDDSDLLEALLNKHLNQILLSLQSEGPEADSAEIRWVNETPQLWVIRKDKAYLLVCLNGTYGGFNITKGAMEWISTIRKSRFWVEFSVDFSVDDRSTYPGSRYQDTKRDFLEERQNAWLPLCYLIGGKDVINPPEDSPLYKRGTHLYLCEIPEDYYHKQFFQITEYDGCEDLTLDTVAMEAWQRDQTSQQTINDLKLVLADQRHTMELMQKEIDDLRAQLREAQLKR